jgi:hypothetical protein
MAKRGRPAKAEKLSPAEKQRRYRERLKTKPIMAKVEGRQKKRDKVESGSSDRPRLERPPSYPLDDPRRVRKQPMLLETKLAQVDPAKAEVIPPTRLDPPPAVLPKFFRGRSPHGPVPKPGSKP